MRSSLIAAALTGKASAELADGASGAVGMKRFVRTTGALHSFTPSITAPRQLTEGEDLPHQAGRLLSGKEKP
ncbi:hypothetical protein ACFCV8_19050 [Streptomyces sp. NPDC056347]|uniref:hypothetical protein n=1 Tax=Streptomyces sp. NPDC056347 TaxID=3345790 RepID=UPI0035D6F17D